MKEKTGTVLGCAFTLLIVGGLTLGSSYSQADANSPGDFTIIDTAPTPKDDVVIFDRDDPPVEVPSYDVNEYGQSYGSTPDLSGMMFEDREEYYAHYPDLIAVYATNGKEGYCYTEDIANKPGELVQNPEEALAYMEELNRNNAIALHNALSKRTSEEITIEQVEKFLEIYQEYSPYKSREDEAKEAGLPTELSEKLIDEAIEEANYEAGYRIPVYESDGKTVVGEFVFSSL